MSDKDLTLIRRDIQSLIRGKTSPPADQISFLKKIMLNQKEYDAFVKDPESYTEKQNPPIVLDPKVVQQVQRTVMFDAAIKADVSKYGKDAIAQLQDIRSQLRLRGPGTVAWPAAVAAIAAVVAAAASVVQAVTAVTKNRVINDPRFSNSRLRMDVVNRMKNIRPF